MTLGAVAVVVGLAVCMVVAVIPAIRILIAQRPRPYEDGGSSDDGGGGLRRPPEPPTPSGADGPAWWPEFERDFARHVADVRRSRSSSL